MSTITKQAVQAVADLKAGYTLGHADVEIIQQMALDAVTLLDELEAKDSMIAAQQHEIRTLLNALEGRPCPKCNDTGMADSGGTQPWGEPISVPCDCAAPPSPVAVPAAMEMDDDFDSAFEHGKAVGWNAYRAAMLQGAEPVTTANKLLDGWVDCSERMPEDDDFVYIWPRPDFGVELHVGQYCECHPKGDGWYAQVYEQNYGIEWCPITVTHWMPLPAAPQQEVTQALAKGMERYGDAMQKLADSGD